MKIQLNHKILLQSLSHIQSVVEAKVLKSILSNVKIVIQKKTISLYTTDLDVFAKESLDLLNHNEYENRCLITTASMNTFYDIIRKVDGQKEIQLIFKPSANPQIMIIKTKLSEFKLPCLQAQEFPVFEESNYVCKFTILSNKLYQLISTIKHAISCDESRYCINGVFFHIVKNNKINILRAIATDTHRLAIGEIILPQNAELFPSIIIPKKTIFELVKLLENFNNNIVVKVSSNKIVFYIGKTTLSSKLIDGLFPNYNKAIPFRNDKLLKISNTKLYKAINLVSAVIPGRAMVIKLEIKNNKVTLHANDKNSTSGTVDINAIYSGDKIEITFNAKYVIDILNSTLGNDMHFKLDSADSAVLIEDSKNLNFRFILMPMQT